jgi:AcrR family transcriptional regulator
VSTQSVSERRARRLAEILDAAWAIAAESGLGAVSLHEVARRVGIRQPSLYGYVGSKVDLYDAMFAQAYEQLLARLDGVAPVGSAREQLMRVSRTVIDFVVENPPRQQLLFTRSIPGFEPSSASYALAKRLVDRCQGLLAALGADSPAHVDVYTVLIAGIGSQQVANDPGGNRYSQHLESLLALFLDHFEPTHTDKDTP